MVLNLLLKKPKAKVTVEKKIMLDIEFETSEDVEVIPTFDNMGLRDELLKGIYAYGFEKPSAIQQRSIKPIMKGRDVIAQAQSGTGKTATFSISILQSLDTQLRETQVLILSHTKERAIEIKRIILALGDFMNIQCHACIGGKKLSEDIQKLEDDIPIVIGTPDKILSMISHNHLQTKMIKMVVYDRIDSIVDSGYKEQIYDVYRYLPPATQVVLVSATLPHDILEMTSKFMTDPIRILAKRNLSITATIQLDSLNSDDIAKNINLSNALTYLELISEQKLGNEISKTNIIRYILKNLDKLIDNPDYKTLSNESKDLIIHGYQIIK